MSALSRREFFKELRGEAARVAEQVSQDLGVSVSRKRKGPREIPVGPISAFPPGETKRIAVGDVSIEISADGEGIRARKTSGEAREAVMIRLRKNGELLVLLDEVCGERDVFSLFSGEMKLG